MKDFEDYINESRFKYAERFEMIDAALGHVDARSRKSYIENLNKFSIDELKEVENGMDAEALKYVNAEIAKTGTWDENKELDIMVNVMEAMIDTLKNGRWS